MGRRGRFLGLGLVVAVVATSCGETAGDAEEPRTDRIRKQVYELRPSDLERFPVWEFATDEEGEPGQDEETVKPRPDVSIVDPSDGIFIVKTELVANDGTRFVGYSTPTDSDHIGYIQPHVVTDRGQVNFWRGSYPPNRRDLQRDYKLLGKTAAELFPVRYRALVKHQGVELEGEVSAFLHSAGPRTERVVAVK